MKGCLLLAIALVFPSFYAQANSGDFSGGVAIGTGYAGVYTAPTNGLIAQGDIGIGTSSPAAPIDVENPSSASTLVNGQFYAPSQPTGGASYIKLGKSPANYNEVGMGFYYAGNNSPSNSFSIGFFGFSPIFTIYGNGETAFSGKVFVGSFASASSTTVCQNGSVLSTCSSAQRYKENIEPSGLGLKEVLSMRPVTFDFRDHKNNWEKHDFGFVAEDMEKVNPLFVTYNDEGDIEGVRYMQLTAVNVKAIQELYNIIQGQEKKIDLQQEEIDGLKQEIDALSQKIDIAR